jgi:hypothetical protein
MWLRFAVEFKQAFWQSPKWNEYVLEEPHADNTEKNWRITDNVVM